MSRPTPIAFRCPRCAARPGEPCANMPADLYHGIRRVVAYNAESEAERQRIAQEMSKP